MVVAARGPLSVAIAQTKASMRQHCLERRFRSTAEAAGVAEQEAQVFRGDLHDIVLSSGSQRALQSGQATAQPERQRKLWV